jgi:hypothetical protein
MDFLTLKLTSIFVVVVPELVAENEHDFYRSGVLLLAKTETVT